MKKKFTHFYNLLILILLPFTILAQGDYDYTIRLNSGNFKPSENVNTLSKNSSVLQNSLFSERHYVTIQFYSLPDENLKASLKAMNIVLGEYIPNYAFTASIPALIDLNNLRSQNIRCVFQFTSAQKTTSTFIQGNIPDYAVKVNGFVDVSVITYEKLSEADIFSSLQTIEAQILSNESGFRTLRIRVPQTKILELISLPFVQWVEPIDPPNQLENLPGRTQHRVNILQDGVRNLKGDGINIGIWDGGEVSPHLDFSPAGRLTLMDFSSESQHSTHVAGTVVGKGIINPSAKGMAPNAKLYSWDFNGNIQTEMATAIPAQNLLLSTHSYGSSGSPTCNLATDPLLAYSTTSRNTDLNLNNFPNHLHVHSAGNSGTTCSGGYYTITGSGKPAKNNLVVANISSTEVIQSSSSSGPVTDGRIKPEISAMGASVFSTSTPLNTYATLSGTSMSTPGVTGTAALLYQRFKQLNASDAKSALIKNVICNGADDLGNSGPDFRYGFGRINGLNAVRILEENRYQVNTIGNGGTNNFIITVPSGTARLKVMLTWNDPAGAANANPALVNNLDLSVIQGANTTLPWTLDALIPSSVAVRALDAINNIEQVTIDNPTAGSYTLRVNGLTVPTGPQEYALTWSIDAPSIEVIYPNGNESLNPGTTETITWNNAGVTSNQTVEYSLNNGSSWTTISTSVSPATTRLSWNVPTANTSQALIRVSSGSLTDMSDATFKILGTTTGFAGSGVSCNAGEIIFTWNAVSNATQYDIYRLDATTGEYVLLVADIASTTYTATGLTPSTSMWFTIRAKNNTSTAISERSVAINVISSAGGGGLGTIGAISGNTLICGLPTNGIIYSVASVSGATSYTWAAPPGATIASGQGTNTITINYGGGSTSGNVSVFASNGSCQTSVVTLAVTVNSSGVTPPATGGNQTASICPGDPMPTLTATATVPGGHTVIWYSAATGGTVVSSPTHSSIGTVTYHAASRQTSTGCESITRTAVTLTITSTQPASITANGPTTFCQGGNVILTANTGTSYSWSNGAITQSITVVASGNFSVTVTTGSCSSTSPSTSVTVNPVPVATITAGGPTTFCQGLNVVLTASTGSSWLWSNGITSQSTTISTSGNYTVTVTNSFGCSATSSVTAVTVNANPPATITASGPLTFCQGGNVILTANTGISYLWSNGATTQSITANTLGTTNYTVQVTQSGGCISNSAVTTVTVNPLPTAIISANGPLVFCEPGNVLLTASTGSSWLWSNGATTQNITVSSPAASGAYTVRVTNSFGCSTTSAATNVTANPRPNITLTAAPYTKLFPGLTTTLTGTITPAGSYTYIWMKGASVVPSATSVTLPVTINEIGSYTLRATNSGGCTNTSNIVTIGDSVTAKLFIMPNPNDGQFQVSYYSSANSSFTMNIFDSKGAQVYSKAYTITTPYQRMDIDIRRYNAGIYTIVLFDKTGKRIATGSVMIN